MTGTERYLSLGASICSIAAIAFAIWSFYQVNSLTKMAAGIEITEKYVDAISSLLPIQREMIREENGKLRRASYLVLSARMMLREGYIDEEDALRIICDFQRYLRGNDLELWWAGFLRADPLARDVQRQGDVFDEC